MAQAASKAAKNAVPAKAMKATKKPAKAASPATAIKPKQKPEKAASPATAMKAMNNSAKAASRAKAMKAMKTPEKDAAPATLMQRRRLWLSSVLRHAPAELIEKVDAATQTPQPWKETVHLYRVNWLWELLQAELEAPY